MPRSLMIPVFLLSLLLTIGCQERPWNKPRSLKQTHAVVKRLTVAGQFEKALELIEKAIKENPGNAKSFFIKGNVLFTAKKYPESLKAFNQATFVDADYAEAWLGGAFASHMLGNQINLAKYLQSSREAFQLRLEHTDQWDMKYRIQKTYETKLHIAIILALQGHKGAAKTQLAMLQKAYPDIASVNMWIKLINQGLLLDALIQQKTNFDNTASTPIKTVAGQGGK